jgi:amiloride-sensitive sodium channel
MKAADKIFSGVYFPKILSELQQNDANLTFYNNTLNKWFAIENEPKTQSGINNGLSFILDAHTDLLASSSVVTDFKGFTGLISAKGSFPLINQRGFQIRPGHNNLISLTATMIEASPDLRTLVPWRRNCIFNDETQNLTKYNEYTQSNCLLECSLKFAQEKVLANSKETCTPWFFPTVKNSTYICDPWSTTDFLNAMYNTPDSRCRDCLPSCSHTVYSSSVTTLPFRRCSDLNIGVSPLCKIHDKRLPDPKLWRDDDSFKRQLLRKVNGKRVLVEYDAYKEDIAMVQVFFEPSAVFLVGSQPSQTWIDYFSSVGGLLGLCLGISIVTFIELFWLAINAAKKLLVPGLEPKKISAWK